MNTKVKTAVRPILWAAQRGRCCYCEKEMAAHGVPTVVEQKRLNTTKKEVARRRATIEHLHRVCEGGTGRRDNLALACFECNAHRGEFDWLTYKSMKLGEIAA